MPASHSTTATGVNDPTKQVSKDAWNADHAVALTDGEHGSRGASLHADSHGQSHGDADHTNKLSDHQAAADPHPVYETAGEAQALVDTHAAISAASTHGSLGHSSANDPTANQKAALAGTGTPSGTDKYVSDSDARNTNARTPTGHHISHEAGGTDVVTVVASQPEVPMTNMSPVNDVDVTAGYCVFISEELTIADGKEWALEDGAEVVIV